MRAGVATTISTIVLWAGPALAACGGADLSGYLSDADWAEVRQAAETTAYGEGLFWTATRGDSELRLVGTMHIHDQRHDRLMARVMPMLSDADLVLLELTAKEEAEVQAAMVSDPDRLFITSGPTLPELLDEATWAALSEAARERQIPPFMAAKFRPWYLSMSLAMPPCAMPDLVAGRRGLDHRIIEAASLLDVPTQAIEPWDTLFRLMEDGTEAEQLDMLRLSIVPPDLQTASLVSMLDGYFSEAIAEVWETSRVSVRYIPGLDPATAEDLFRELQAGLLDDRNRNWIPVIEAAADDHDTIVIAVGAAHLPGDAGVLNLLADRGWQITRITHQ